MLKTLSTVVVGLVVCMAPAASWAVTYTYGFENEPTDGGYRFRETASSTARRSSDDEPVRTGSYSARLNTVNDKSAIDFGDYFEFGRVRDVTVSFWSYVDSSGTSDNVGRLRPYAHFAVDANKNGYWDGNDAWIIATDDPNSSLNVWQEMGLNGSSKIHVYQNDTSKLRGTLLRDLYDMENDVTDIQYGDMPIFRVFIGTGTWGPDSYNHLAYVDDVTITAVPEPMTMLAFGTAVAGLGGYIRRRRRS